MQPTPPAGWYPDPWRGTALRWWDGTSWTWWTSDGVTVRDEQPSPLGPEHLEGLRFVQEVYLPEVRRRGVLPEPQVHELARFTDHLVDGARPADAPAAQPAAATAEPVLAPPTPAPAQQPQPHPTSPFAHPTATTRPTTARPTTARPTTARPAPAGPARTRPAPAAPRPAPRPGTTTRAHPVASRPAGPGPVARWWATVRARLDLDLTVHGLAYLGVLLLFVGVFGLVAFAFGDVVPRMRPVAELAVAVVPFVAARVLAGSGATFVARAMVALGGLLLALMLITSTADGAPIPPDLHGAALPLGAGLGCAALAAAYLLIARRRPETALVAVVAPVLWLAAAMSAVGLGRPVPTGEDVAVPGAAQTAVLALAVLTTTALARAWLRRRGRLIGRLADGARAAALPGVVVVGVLGVAAGLVEGWPVLPFVVTVLALAATVRLAGRTSPASGDLVLVLAWLVVVLRLLATDLEVPLYSGHHGPAVGAAVLPVLLPAALVLGVLLAEALLERGRGDGRVLLVWALPVVGLLTVPDGWWAVGSAAVLTVWAAWRRCRPTSARGLAAGLDVTAAGAPLLVLVAAARELDGPSTLLLAAGLVLAATPLARGRLRRPDAPALWQWWWALVGVGTLVGSSVGVVDGWLSEGLLWPRAAVPGAALVLLVALLLGPLPRTWTVLAATPVVWWAWLTGAGALEVDVLARAGVLALLGLGAVLLAHRPTGPDPDRRRALGVLGLAGHGTAVVAGLVALDPTPAARTPHLFGEPAFLVALTAATLAGTFGWLATALASDRAASDRTASDRTASDRTASDRTGSAVVELTDRLGAVGRRGPWAVALTGSVMSTVLVLHLTGAVPVGHRWWAVVPAGAGLVLAGLTRVLRTGRVLVLLPWFGFGLVLLAVPAAAPGWPLAVALAAVIAGVLLTRRAHPVLVWTGWLTVMPLVLVVAWQLAPGVLPRSLLTAGGLAAVGGLLAAGAYVADRARPGDPRVLPRRPAALPPAVLGAAQVVLGVLVASGGLSTQRAAVVLAVAAVAVGVLAALTGIGAVGTVAVLLGWLAVEGLLGPDHPGAWAHVATALAMAAVAQGLAGEGPPRVRWARWDVPLAAGAALPALVALQVTEPHERLGVHLVLGAAVVAAAVSLHRLRAWSETLGWIGTALILSATLQAGPWWTVLALATLSAAHTGLARVRERGPLRRVRQWIGALAAAAAWLVVPTAAGWDLQRAAEVTAVVASAALLAVVLGVLGVGRGRSWLLPWGGVGAVLALGAVLVGPAPATWWHVVAWVLLTAAAVALVRVTAWAWWREVAALTTTAGLLTGLGAADLPGAARLLTLVIVSTAAAVAVVLLRRAGTGRQGPGHAGPEHAGPGHAGPGRARSAWARPVAVLGVATVGLAALTLAGLAGDGTAANLPVLTGAVLAAAAVQSAGLGVAWQVLALRLAAPVLAWCAWAVYAAQSLGASPVWFTVPVGLAVLAVVALWRADRRDRGLPPVDTGVVALELAGVAFLVVSSFVAAVTDSVLHAVVAAALGVLVALWGVVTRVRRRLLAGTGVVLAGVAVAVVVPLAALLPSVGQVGAWVLVAVLGLTVVGAATMVERGRTTARGGRRRLAEATQGWE